ncbi:Os11g0298833, partial [Oryza sativa Japonica Group]
GGLVEHHAGHPRHRVAGVRDAEHLDAELIAPSLELEVADARAAEGEDGDRDGAAAAAAAAAVEAQLGEVVAEEDRQRAPHAVSGEGDADVVVLVLVDEAGHLGEELVPAAPAGELAGEVVGGVEGEEPGLDAHVGARVGRVEPRRRQRAHEVGQPLRSGHRAAEGDEDVAAAEAGGLAVGRDGDVADPPALAGAGAAAADAEGQRDVGGGVDVPGDRVPGAGHADRRQHLLLAVLAVEVALRRRVEVERPVARRDELPVPDHLVPEQRVERLHHAPPVAGALHLPPRARQRRHRRR